MEVSDGSGADGTEELELLTTEVLKERMKEAFEKDDYSTSEKISKILKERKNPQQGSSAAKIPRLDGTSTDGSSKGEPTAI